MSPVAFNNFRSTQTRLDLNGPTIAITENPVDVVTQAVGVSSFVGVAGTVGIATFIGVSTATLGTPNAPGVSPTQGEFVYQWHTGDGVKVTDGVNISGSGTTTLTISNIKSPDDDGKTFYLESSFSSGTYDTTTGRGVGNALNGPLKTTTAALKVLPTVTVTSEPPSVTIGQGEVATFTSSAETTDPDLGALSFQWTVDGENVVDEGRRDALVGNYASGANTTSLEIKKTTVGVSTVQFNAFVDVEGFRVAAKTKGCDFTGVLPRRLIRFEAYTPATNLYKTLDRNIGEDGAFTLDSNTFGSDYGIVQFHSPEDNFTLRMTLKAAKGADSDNFSGGGGGTGIIDFRLNRNIEYTLVGVANNSSIFLYRGSVLMAVVGQGGDAGIFAGGGAGGGVNMAGENGDGKNGGQGGLRVGPGGFALTGQWGSILSNSSFTLRDADIVAGVPFGGTTISCSKGEYWINQGIDACFVNSSSEIKYRGIDGTEIADSALITRGFKPGYSISETSGLAIADGGNGGNGATGGSGGVSGDGGGGGSGYTDDTFDIINAELGGNTTTSSTVTFQIGV